MALSNFFRCVGRKHLEKASVMDRRPKFVPLSFWVYHSGTFFIEKIGIRDLNKLYYVLLTRNLSKSGEDDLERRNTLLAIDEKSSRRCAKCLLGWFRIYERAKIMWKRRTVFKPLYSLVAQILP
jgi:hypothetical protein